MKDLDKRLREDIAVLTKEKEDKLISEWLAYDERTNNPTFICSQELAELICAINKWAIPGHSDAKTWLNIAEELADVQIISKMIQKRYDITDDLLAKIRTLKLTVPIPEDTPDETEQTREQSMSGGRNDVNEVYSYEGMMNVLKEFRSSVISTRGIFNTVIVDHETGEPCTGSEWNAMSVNERKDVLMTTLNYCEATILYERKLRGIAGTIPPPFVTTDQNQSVQQISDRAIEIIELIMGSNIDPYFWSFPKETLYAHCKVYWATGIEFLANWRKCVLKCVDEICAHSILHENGRAFSVDETNIFGDPLEVPIVLYNILSCLQMNNAAWLKNHNLGESVKDIRNQLISNPNMSVDATNRIIDMICYDFREINEILADLIEHGISNPKLSAILVYLDKLQS